MGRRQWIQHFQTQTKQHCSKETLIRFQYTSSCHFFYTFPINQPYLDSNKGIQEHSVYFRNKGELIQRVHLTYLHFASYSFSSMSGDQFKQGVVNTTNPIYFLPINTKQTYSLPFPYPSSKDHTYPLISISIHSIHTNQSISIQFTH